MQSDVVAARNGQRRANRRAQAAESALAKEKRRAKKAAERAVLALRRNDRHWTQLLSAERTRHAAIADRYDVEQRKHAWAEIEAGIEATEAVAERARLKALLDAETGGPLPEGWEHGLCTSLVMRGVSPADVHCYRVGRGWAWRSHGRHGVERMALDAIKAAEDAHGGDDD